MRTWLERHPVIAFYALVFAISWGGILFLVGPGNIPGTAEQVERLFPFVLLALFAGPSVAGLVMTGVTSGRAGLRDLVSRLVRWRVGTRWWVAALLTGPLLVAGVLFGLSLYSPEFRPGILDAPDKERLVMFGLGWGLLGGGFLEELGWTGFAVPRLRRRVDAVRTGLIVGLLWGAWHLLIAFWSSRGLAGGGSAGDFVAGFLAFYVLALPAYRILMVHVYDRTRSLLLAMLMHAMLSASTLILQPGPGSGQLTWNLVLAVAAWILAICAAYLGRVRSTAVHA